MKHLLFLSMLLLFACGNSAHHNATQDTVEISDDDKTYPDEASRLVLDPFVHFELLSSRGEDEVGSESYVYVLPVDFRSNGNVAETIAENIQHSADICNGGTDTNLVDFPYIRYKQFQDSPKRGNTWVFVSQRLVPSETIKVEAWMDSVAALFPHGINDPVSTHPLTIYKKKWHSTDIQ